VHFKIDVRDDWLAYQLFGYNQYLLADLIKRKTADAQKGKY